MNANANALRLRLRSYVVIPARLASTRLPRKLLLRETGKTLIQHTYEAARRAALPLDVIVAADDEEIASEVRRFGGEVRMTRPDAASGTDRVAEVADSLASADVIVNVQGDEPEISGASIDRVIELLEDDPAAVMATLATPIRDQQAVNDPACVKVVFDQSGRALYFSRSPIPCARQWDDGLLDQDPPVYHQHLGVYAYRRNFLLSLASLPVGKMERVECLEQLRVLENGYAIQVGVVSHAGRGIDTPQDYRAFVTRHHSC
jgi:3-deoxy-manno-octulosonate cytidylyltransferase (CMP-KDO synthetase)